MAKKKKSVDQTSSPTSLRVLAACAVLVAFAAYALWMFFRSIYDPEIVFLTSEGGASWIRFNEAVELQAQSEGGKARDFRLRFEIARVPAEALLHVRALKLGRVVLDDRPIEQSDDPLEWKSGIVIDLAPHLEPGDHVLRIQVANELGQAAVLAYSHDLAIRTGAHWEASADGLTWTPALPAGKAQQAEISTDFPTARSALARKLPIYLPIFLLSALFILWNERRPPDARIVIAASHVRWAALGLWMVLGLNNLFKLPAHLGFDSGGHVEYVQYLASTWRIPLANEGWQTFQPPLYYAICAFFFPITSGFGALATLAPMRLVSILSGAAQIEIAYRVMRLVFPEKPALQSWGVAFVALLPMNLYLSQYPGNEPLTGFLSAWAILLSIEIARGAAEKETRKLWLLGAVFGLAMLAKVTAILLAPVIGFAIFYAHRQRRPKLRSSIEGAAGASLIVFGFAVVIAGWYYLRNWVKLGRAFIGGWDPNRGIDWWQDPGYRTWGQLLRFGESLNHAVYSGVNSFLDGAYSTCWGDGYLGGIIASESGPPWNYGFMLSSMWLALAPTAAILVGFAIVWRKHSPEWEPAMLIAATCSCVYALALLHHFLTVPFFCTTKAFYLLGATPCFAILFAMGLDWMTRAKPFRIAIYSLLVCWGFASYLSYFVL